MARSSHPGTCGISGKPVALAERVLLVIVVSMMIVVRVRRVVAGQCWSVKCLILNGAKLHRLLSLGSGLAPPGRGGDRIGCCYPHQLIVLLTSLAIG